MAEVVLFHHAHGLTAGCRAFADRLRAAGHTVHTPDLFEGRTFDELAAGVAHAEEIGFATLLERGRAAAQELPPDVVYAGFSLGVLPAQLLAQTRSGARGALLVHSCVRPSDLDGEWPAQVAVQIHLTEHDEWVLPPNDDLAAARELEAAVEGAELFLYPGDGHLFADDTLPGYEESSAKLLEARALELLRRVE